MAKEIAVEPVLTATNIGEFVHYNSCERRFKLDYDKRRLARSLPFSERLFNSLDPILQEQGKAREDEWETNLQGAGLIEIAPYNRVERLGPPLEVVISELGQATTRTDIYAREVALEGRIESFAVMGRLDFFVLRWMPAGPEVLLVECKSSRRDRTYHRIQLAIYVALVRQRALEGGITVCGHTVAPTAIRGVVARVDETTNAMQPILELPPLDLTLELADVRRLLAADGTLRQVLSTELDAVPYRLEAKCDACVFSVHCFPWSAQKRRLELIGASPSIARTLRQHGTEGIDELADLDLAGPTATALRGDIGLTEPVERLKTLALTRRARMSKTEDQVDAFPVQWFEHGGFGQLPSHERNGIRLARVYLSVEYDYSEDRIGALAAHVTNSIGNLHTDFEVGPDNRRRAVAGVLEREKIGTDERGKPIYQHRALSGTELIDIVQADWSHHTVADTNVERQMLLNFFARLVDDISRLGSGAVVAVHFYVWSRMEMTRLIEACARVGGAALTNLRELLGCREHLEQLIFSCLQDEVDQRYALGWTGRGLAVATSLPWLGRTYHWQRRIFNEDVDLDRVFEQDIFDFKSTLELDADGNFAERTKGDRKELFEIRSRFNDSLSAPYFRAYWRTLVPKPSMSAKTKAAIERYNRAAAPGRLVEYLKARVHALRWIDESIPLKNGQIDKPPIPIVELPQFNLNVRDVGRAGIDFLKLDFHVGIQEWLSSHLPTPADRVSTGKTLPIRDVDIIGEKRLRAIIDGTSVGMTLDELRSRTSFAPDGFVRLSPCRPQPNEAQNIYDFFSEGKTCTIDRIDWTTGEVHLDVIPGSRSAYSFTSFITGTEGRLFDHATIDESISDFVSGRVEARLLSARGNHALRWFDPINPEIPSADPVAPELTTAYDRLLKNLVLDEKGGRLNEEQRHAIIYGLDSRVQLLQGPPGTGKTTVTAVATLLRAMHFCRQGDIVVVAAHTHTAIDTVLKRIARYRDPFAGGLKAAGISDLPVIVAKVRSFDDGSPQIAPDIEDVYPYGAVLRRIRDLRGRGIVVLGGTTPAVLKYVRKLEELRSFGMFAARAVIVDEASMMVLPHFIAIATLVGPEGSIFMAGDHRQLPPIVSHNWDDEDRPPVVLYQPFVSAYAAVDRIAHSNDIGTSAVRVDRLAYTYRLPTVVIDLLNRLYVRDALTLVGKEAMLQPEYRFGEPLKEIWRQTRGLFLVVHDERASRETNPTEATIIEDLLAAASGWHTLGEDVVAILTPHRAQRSLLKQHLSQELEAEGGSVKVIDTVEKMQGGECRNIIVSGTVSDASAIAATSDFYLNLNRSNVAFSRTQERLIVVCAATLLDHIPAAQEDYDQALLWKSLRLICDVELGNIQIAGATVRVFAPSQVVSPKSVS